MTLAQYRLLDRICRLPGGLNQHGSFISPNMGFLLDAGFIHYNTDLRRYFETPEGRDAWKEYRK